MATESAPECGGCHRPTGDGTRLCAACTAHLRGLLGTVRELADDLVVTRTKQDRIGGGEARVTGTVEKPLGFRPGAMEAADILTATLRVWASMIVGLDRLSLGDDAAALAATLLAEIDTVRRHDDAGIFLGELMYAVKMSRSAVDRPPGKTYAGPCDQCKVDLYARMGASTIICVNCRTRYSTEARRSWLLESLRDHVATPAEIALGIGELHGEKINRKTINQWHHRNRLVPAGFTPGGEPMFRIGDVLELAMTNSRRKNKAD